MDDKGVWISLVAIIGIVSGSCFGLYKFGRYIERRDLTHFFIQMTEKTYYEAYGDGFTAGALYQKKATPICPRLEDDDDGRY